MKKMWKLIFAILITCCLITAIPAQRKSRQAGILIDSTKPAVFVSFLRETEVLSDNREILLFRLTNNTRWNIWLDMSGVTKKEYGDASLYYAIEDKEKGTVLNGSIHCRVCSMNPLRPGRSIVFSVPISDVSSREERLRLAYSFEWERENDSTDGSNSTHSVEYYFNSLPKSISLDKRVPN